MPSKNQPGPAYLDDDHQRLAETADWLYGDDPEERDLFFDYHMEKRGYKRTAGWSLPDAPADPDPQAGNGAPPVQPQQPRRPAYFKRA